jgi:hypothetical protein
MSAMPAHSEQAKLKHTITIICLRNHAIELGGIFHT